jgi:1,4-alpha-glucan branching enzyme
MKHKKAHETNHSTGPQLELVCFDFTHPTATAVSIAGTFNDWQPKAKPMHSAGGGRWHNETVLQHGSYEYCLVVDGHWMPDPLVKETTPNPFGGMNSVLKVSGSSQAVHLAEAEHLPLKCNSPPGMRAL